MIKLHYFSMISYINVIVLIEEIIVYAFRLPCKIIFFHIRFYVKFWYSFLLLKRRKKFVAKNFNYGWR